MWVDKCKLAIERHGTHVISLEFLNNNLTQTITEALAFSVRELFNTLSAFSAWFPWDCPDF